jgi:hypothetical protein
MKTYTSLASTLYDEEHPIGHLGRGTHYSILRTTTWVSGAGGRLDKPHLHDFAVIWDEDHDERVIEAVQRIYREGLLSPVVVIGERKGSLTVLTATPPTEDYIESIRRFGKPDDDDCWDCHVYQLGDPESFQYIIHDSEERVDLYLRNIVSIWNLGVHPL